MIGPAVTRRAGWVLLGVAALTAFMAWQASQVGIDFSIGRLYGTDSPENRAYERFRGDFGTDDLILYVAFPCEDPFIDETTTRLRALGDRISRIEGVRSTYSIVDALAVYRGSTLAVATSPLFRGTLVADDGKAVSLWILLDRDVASAGRRSEVLEKVRGELPSPEFFLSGLTAVENEYIVLTERDLKTFMPIAGVIFVVLLALYFRNVAGVVLPLLTVAIGILWTIGTMNLFGFSMSILSSLIPNLVLILGIADGVHVLTRHQEDLRAEPDRRAALLRTLRVMIPACFLTSFTTSAGFASLVTTGVGTIIEFGLFSAAGIMIAYLVSITFLPAMLDRLPPFRGRSGDAAATRFWDRLLESVANANVKGKIWILAILVGFLGLSGFGIARLRLESSWLHDLREDNRVHRAHVFFHERLTGVFTVDLRLDGPVRDLEWLRKVDAFQGRLRAWEWEGERGVRHLTSYVDLIKELDPLLRRTLPATQKEYDARLRLYEERLSGRELGGRLIDASGRACRISLRMNRMTSKSLDTFAVDLEQLKGGLDVTITGKTWLAKRAMDRVVVNMLWSLGAASLVIFASMSILFRSALTGLLSMIPNLVPMIFTAGFMGWMGIDLNFSTVTVFSIALGIAVDSTIHYLARLRLESARESDPVIAMRKAVRGAGAPMIFTTALLILGFGSILTSNFIFTFHFGLLGAFALITALLGDLFVAPILFMVFGQRAGGRRPYNSEEK